MSVKKSDAHIRDTTNTSRKGRPPKNEVAMTSAERKRLQRKRERHADADLPSWLRFRREIWQMVQQHYMLNNPDEIAHALRAVADAITATSIWQESRPDDRDFYLGPLEALHDPKNASTVVVNFFGDTLLEYQEDEGITAKHPGLKGKILLDLLRDLLPESRKAGAE